jgi:putative ABC transport system substrate-binding protein
VRPRAGFTGNHVFVTNGDLAFDYHGYVMRFRFLVAVVALATVTLSAHAQPLTGKVARVGLLGATSLTGYARQIAAMRQGFRELGYIEGQNLVLEYRWAEGRYDRLPALAEELIRLQPDVIVTSGPGARVLKQATVTIPIVTAVVGDAVAEGLVATLARPGGNLTGSTFFGPELSAKRLEILKGAVPRLTRVAALMNPKRENAADLEMVRKTAATLKVELVEVTASAPGQFEDAFAAALRQRADGLVILSDTMFVANMRRLGELSATKHVPGAGSDEYAEGGGLVAYGVNFPELWRRAPYFVDRILKGGSPATIPVEQASKFELIVNLKTAKAMGLPVQQSLLLRADHVIE